MMDGISKDPPAKFYDIGTKKTTPKNNRFFDLKGKSR